MTKQTAESLADEQDREITRWARQIIGRSFEAHRDKDYAALGVLHRSMRTAVANVQRHDAKQRAQRVTVADGDKIATT